MAGMAGNPLRRAGRQRRVVLLRLLAGDPVALLAVSFIALAILAALVGPELLWSEANKVNLAARNAPPGFEFGWQGIFGMDPLGRSLLARVIVAARATIGIAVVTAVAAMVIGGFVGLVAGYVGKWLGRAIMQVSDLIQSFPSILFAIVVLYVFGPSIINLIVVLTLTRIPEYLRVVRSEVLEVRKRLFVEGAITMGGGTMYIMRTHIVPIIAPTVLNILSVDVAFVMLSESGLSFLGIGIQSPDITWGIMVSAGKNYLVSAWWVSFFPGLMIMLFTLSVNMLYRWYRRVSDPRQRWRYWMAP